MTKMLDQKHTSLSSSVFNHAISCPLVGVSFHGVRACSPIERKWIWPVFTGIGPCFYFSHIKWWQFKNYGSRTIHALSTSPDYSIFSFLEILFVFILQSVAIRGGWTAFSWTSIRVRTFSHCPVPSELVMLTVAHLMPYRCRQRMKSFFCVVHLFPVLQSVAVRKRWTAFSWTSIRVRTFSHCPDRSDSGNAHCCSSDASQVQAENEVLFSSLLERHNKYL